MSSPPPPPPPTDVPPILYCALPKAPNEDDKKFLRSESLEAALTRLMQSNGTIRTVKHEDHLALPEVYVVRLECQWPNGKAKTISDPRQGTLSLRDEGYDVVIRTQTRGNLVFVVLNPLKVVYRVSLHRLSSLPVTIAQKSDTDTTRYLTRAKSDPRQPQEEVDAMLLKLDPSHNPLDQFSVAKVAASHRENEVWAKKQIVSILRRCFSGPDQSACWHYILSEGESLDEIRLRVLFWSFGRTVPEKEKGLRAIHSLASVSKDQKAGTCLRPSHLELTSFIDTSVVIKAVDTLSGMLGEFYLSKEATINKD